MGRQSAAAIKWKIERWGAKGGEGSNYLSPCSLIPPWKEPSNQTLFTSPVMKHEQKTLRLQEGLQRPDRPVGKARPKQEVPLYLGGLIVVIVKVWTNSRMRNHRRSEIIYGFVQGAGSRFHIPDPGWNRHSWTFPGLRSKSQHFQQLLKEMHLIFLVIFSFFLKFLLLL